MQKGVVYGAWAAIALIFVRMVLKALPGQWREGSYMVIMSLLTLSFLTFLVWAYRKRKFH